MNINMNSINITINKPTCITIKAIQVAMLKTHVLTGSKEVHTRDSHQIGMT